MIKYIVAWIFMGLPIQKEFHNSIMAEEFKERLIYARSRQILTTGHSPIDSIKLKWEKY